ncbi:MAG: DUF4846 domain-containing protein [Eubacteriales bacterium]|nr:DUF4846 domain-containing protein [Eubacteriales bacterium]
MNNSGNTPEERFRTPAEYKRMPLASGSFGEYLRELPLKPHGTKVYYYDGRLKSPDVHEAVIDMDTGPRDLQQCADAVIRLRAEYLYARGEYDRISFNFTNGFRADYRTWLNGSRIRVEGNEASWISQGKKLEGYDYFREYLDMVFSYAGTLSLSQEMLNIPLSQMQPGDIFLKGPYPGHCVIVIDMAEDPLTGRKKFMLAQSYMPAQDIHILKNPANEQGDPWYDLDFGVQLETPQWNFTTDQLYRFRE